MLLVQTVQLNFDIESMKMSDKLDQLCDAMSDCCISDEIQDSIRDFVLAKTPNNKDYQLDCMDLHCKFNVLLRFAHRFCSSDRDQLQLKIEWEPINNLEECYEKRIRLTWDFLYPTMDPPEEQRGTFQKQRVDQLKQHMDRHLWSRLKQFECDMKGSQAVIVMA